MLDPTRSAIIRRLDETIATREKHGIRMDIKRVKPAEILNLGFLRTFFAHFGRKHVFFPDFTAR